MQTSQNSKERWTKLAVIVRSYVEATIQFCDYDRKQAAALLGISARTIDIWLSTWGLSGKPPYYRRGEGRSARNKTNRVRIPARAFLEET